MEGLPDQGIWAYFVLIVRTLLAMIFLIAGTAKLRDLAGFEHAVQGFGWVPARWQQPLARVIPIAEVAVGLGLIIGLVAPWPLIAAIALLAMFTLAVSISLLRGRRDLLCGCFGRRLDRRVGPSLLLRNAALISLALMSLVADQSGAAAWPFGGSQTVGVTEGLVAMMASAAVSLLLVALPDVRLALFSASPDSDRQAERIDS